ncbi:MAG: hypothetical protein IJG17_06295 [Eubacterium sp.]|nr:hypothetical protein [Eubacterium sp.]
MELMRRRGMMSVPATASGYVTDGLIAYWDGIDNTGGQGHDPDLRSWVDLVNGYTWTFGNGTPAFGTDGITFTGTSSQVMEHTGSFWTRPQYSTIEMVCTPSANASLQAAILDTSDTSSGGYFSSRGIFFFSDNTVNFIGDRSKTYATGLSSIMAVKKLGATYNGFIITGAYVNGSSVSLGSVTHSFRSQNKNFYLGAGPTGGYPFNGIIRALRVYNRELTAAERAQNDAYDNIRYNLNM